MCFLSRSKTIQARTLKRSPHFDLLCFLSFSMIDHVHFFYLNKMLLIFLFELFCNYFSSTIIPSETRDEAFVTSISSLSIPIC